MKFVTSVPGIGPLTLLLGASVLFASAVFPSMLRNARGLFQVRGHWLITIAATVSTRCKKALATPGLLTSAHLPGEGRGITLKVSRPGRNYRDAGWRQSYQAPIWPRSTRTQAVHERAFAAYNDGSIQRTHGGG